MAEQPLFYRYCYDPFGFNGECPDPVTGHYLLGNGYRAFNPVLMRFNSPDALSPFESGGLNAYAYCQGDPINYSDQAGTAPVRVGRTFRFLPKAPSQWYDDPENIIKQIKASTSQAGRPSSPHTSAMLQPERPPLAGPSTASSTSPAAPSSPRASQSGRFRSISDSKRAESDLRLVSVDVLKTYSPEELGNLYRYNSRNSNKIAKLDWKPRKLHELQKRYIFQHVRPEHVGMSAGVFKNAKWLNKKWIKAHLELPRDSIRKS